MKNPKNFAKSQTKEVFSIFNKIKKRDFEGNTGIAIKNSTYQTFTNITTKIGGLIFTVILTRFLLGPELFGMYSLALTTILLFQVFANLGINQTIIKTVSSSLGKNNERKAKAYFYYLVKVKFILTLTVSSLLVISAKFISHSFYQQPIFYALLAGSLYLLLLGAGGVVCSIFEASNDFKKVLKKELIVQITKLIFVPIIILLTINRVSINNLMGFIFIALSFSLFIGFLFIYFSAKRQILFLREKTTKLSKKEKRIINLLIIPLSAIAISSALFGYIDTIMLGRFIPKAEFIGFYRVALTLITSATPFLTFSGALFPLFNQLKGKALNRGIRKSIKLTLFITVPCFILVLFLSSFIVQVIFGSEYLQSANILRIFSILLIISPLIAMYSSILISQNKYKKVVNSLVIASIINIILNYILITSLIQYGFIQAVYGATIATIISKFVYLGMLIFKK